MIDIHSHLLPGVDDGSPSIAVSAPVLERFAADGVECVVLTPHLVASRADSAPYERHVEILETLRAAVPGAPELRLGWEIMLDVPNADLRAAHLGLGRSRAVLVEFPLNGVPVGAAAELFRIRSAGDMPVLAHPERYWGCTVQKVVEWRAAGAVIQVDTAGLIGKGDIATISRALLEAGLRGPVLERQSRRFALAGHGARLAPRGGDARACGAAHAHERAAVARRQSARAGAPAPDAERRVRPAARAVHPSLTPRGGPAPSHSFLHEPMSTHFSSALRELAATAERVATELETEMDHALGMVRATVSAGGTLFFCGNGGSAADAQHMATEYVVRYMRNRRAYPAHRAHDRHLAAHRGGERHRLRERLRAPGRGARASRATCSSSTRRAATRRTCCGPPRRRARRA